MLDAMDWARIKRFLENKSLVIITTHVNPDGDGLGSEMAISDYCRQLGVKNRIVNVDPTPKLFEFLDPDRSIEIFNPEIHPSVFKRADALFMVDVSELDRLGVIREQIQSAGLEVGCLDHHIYNGPEFDMQIIDTDVSSTGELIFNALDHLGAEWTRVIVQSLYTCVLTDTGSFRFSNTTAFTHRMAARLIEYGADFTRIYQSIYESESPGHFLLKGKLLSSMQYECNDRLVWYVLTQDLLRESGVPIQETEGYSELPRQLKNLEISIMFTELQDNRVKASFRSKGRVPINELAKQFGGGGHKFAAGASFKVPLQEVIDQVVCKACNYLETAMRTIFKG